MYENAGEFRPLFEQLFASCEYLWVYAASAAGYLPFDEQRQFGCRRGSCRDGNALPETGVAADVTQAGDWDRVLEQVMAASGRVDVLVNNAGASGRIAPTAELSDAEILDCLQLNLGGVILGCRRVAPIMRQQGAGTIVNISSVCARYSWPGWSIYSAAKAGLERFSKGLCTELRPHGVRVTTVTPSWGATDFCEASGIHGHPATDPAVRAKCIQPVELGRIVADIVELPAHLEILETTVLPLVQEISPL